MRYKRKPTKAYSLAEAPPVWGTGPDGNCSLAIVGEAPGREEEEAGEPFVGKAGKFLHWGLSESGIYRPGVWVTNVLSRRPPNNDIKSHEAREALAAERDEFRAEIEWLVREKGVRVILAMGNTAKDAFSLPSSITKIRGSVYEFDFIYWRPVDDPSMEPCDVVIIPTFHPSYLMRSRFSRGAKGSADQSTVWLGDLDRAKEIAHNGWNRPKENFILEPQLDHVRDFLEDAIEQKRDLAVDIETTGFNARHGEIVCIGLARSDTDALVIPYLTSRGRRYWLPGEEREIRALLDRAFSHCGLYFQNALFDVSWLRRAGFAIGGENVTHDSLLLHHALSPELPHNLGFIVSQYGATPYWKEDFLNRDVSILEMDQIEMRRYNARDCVVLHQVIPKMLEDLEAQNNTEIYTEENLAMIEPVLQMQETGVLVDPKEMKRWNDYLDRKIKAFEHALRTLGKLPDAFSLDSRTDLRLFLFGAQDPKYDKADLLEKKKPGTKVYAELNRLDQIRTHTKPLHEIRGFSARRTDGGQIKTDKQGRLSLQIHLQNRLSKLSHLKRWTDAHTKENTSIRKLLAWLTLYNRYTQLVKLKSTYGSYPVQQDGRIHPNYLIHGTATGRLSSRNPNCFPPWVELLTDRGWMRFDQAILQGDLKVAQFDTESNTLSYVQPLDWVRYQYEGDLVSIRTHDQISLLSTDDHEHLLQNRQTGAWEKHYARDYPSDRKQYHAVPAPITGSSVPPEIILEAAIQADGSVVTGGGIEFSLRKRRKSRRLCAALDALEIPYRLKSFPTRDRIYIGKTACGTHNLFEKKFFTQKSLASRTRLEKIQLFGEIMQWDGNATGLEEGFWAYCSAHKENVDFVQALAVEAGWRSHYRIYKGTYHILELTARPFSLTTNHTKERIPYSGEVFCVTVPTHNIFVRHENSVSLTGQCQNIPKKEPRARKPLIAGAGKTIVSLDYSNLEVWVLAYETEDPVLIEILESGKNVHDENTKLLFHLGPDDKHWTLARRAAKIFFFGGIAYGGGPQEIHQKVSLEVPELALTFADYTRAKQRYEDAHPAYQDWRARIIKQVHTSRSITNAFGRTRIFYGNERDIEKEALNFPVQSGAASVINRATVRIAADLKGKEDRARLQAQIHDELRFEVAHRHVDWLIELAKGHMEQNVRFYNRDVSFPVDVEVGPSWGSLEKKEPAHV